MNGYIGAWVRWTRLVSGSFVRDFNAGKKVKISLEPARGFVQILLPILETEIWGDYLDQWVMVRRKPTAAILRDLCQHDPAEDRE